MAWWTTAMLLAVEAWVFFYSLTGVVVYGVRSEDVRGESCVWLGVLFSFAVVVWTAVVLFVRMDRTRASIPMPTKPSRRSAPCRRDPVIVVQPTSIEARYGDTVRLTVQATVQLGDSQGLDSEEAVGPDSPSPAAHQVPGMLLCVITLRRSRFRV
jgi:hypothetical protein